MRGGLFAARSVAVLIDLVGEPHVLPVVLAVLGGLCLASGHPRLAALAVAGPLVSGAGTTILKPVVGRTINGDHLAFPSGHTAVATAIALVVALLVIGLLRPGWVGAMLLFLTAAAVAGTAMAWSQVLLDAHYATDALGGFFSALAVVPATAWTLDRIADRLPQSGR